MKARAGCGETRLSGSEEGEGSSMGCSYPTNDLPSEWSHPIATGGGTIYELLTIELALPQMISRRLLVYDHPTELVRMELAKIIS